MISIKYAILILLLCCTLTFTPGCSNFRPSWISEESFTVEGVDGPIGGHFDGDKWIPDNPDIEYTYKIPDIGAGFIFDIADLSVSPSLQIELLEFNTFIPYVNFIKIDAGVAYQRAYLYVGKLWTSVFEISTGGFIGWNFEDWDLTYGVAFTIIHF